jgi:hypothetical protein
LKKKQYICKIFALFFEHDDVYKLIEKMEYQSLTPHIGVKNVNETVGFYTEDVEK